uniref:Uncharacterized protein n=1 Tax=Heterorhabditis bacteriophora TaxID=37862 RepID=A0A1I7X2C0_HETBA
MDYYKPKSVNTNTIRLGSYDRIGNTQYAESYFYDMWSLVILCSVVVASVLSLPTSTQLSIAGTIIPKNLQNHSILPIEEYANNAMPGIDNQYRWRPHKGNY